MLGVSSLLNYMLLCKRLRLLQPSILTARRTPVRFFDFYEIANKAAILKERERIKDEINRGYFADISEFNQHRGKIAAADEVLVPAGEAVKFPSFKACYSNGTSLNLPICLNENEDAANFKISKATFMCLMFRANSKVMTDSWIKSFQNSFSESAGVQLYEVSFIDSWLLSLSPIKRLLLRMMGKANSAQNDILHKHHKVYSFGDNYYFRKELSIINLLTCYVYLVDKLGRTRWQGCGMATEKELSSLISCTSLLLKE